ncbi:hypothetical protein [Nocardia rhamnosiphila]
MGGLVPDERALTAAIRDELAAVLAAGFDLPGDKTRPDPDHYVMFPLHVAPGGAFSIASAVWNVGQGTPVHGHGTWGVVGIHRGTEIETRAARKKLVPRTAARTCSAHWAASTYSSVARMKVSQGVGSGLSGSCAWAAAPSGSGSLLKALKA